MPISIFDPVTLAAMVRQLPDTPRFLKDMFFKNRIPEPTTRVSFDVYKGKRRVAPYVSPRQKTPVAEKIGYTTNEADTPLVAVKDITTIEDVLKRLPGEVLMNSGVSPQERGLEMLARTMQDYDAQIGRREEIMCAEALFEGVIHVMGDDVNYDIDFGLTNKGTASPLWDEPSSDADPIKDLQGWANQCIIKGYKTPNVCIMSQNAYDAFLDRCIALGYMDQWHLLNLESKPQIMADGVYYAGRLRMPDLQIYVYNQYYIDNWTDPDTPTEKNIVPKGKILIASESMLTTLFYGVLGFSDPVTETITSIMATRGADSWVEKDPDRRYFRMQSRPLPVPQEIDSWFVATVAATE